MESRPGGQDSEVGAVPLKSQLRDPGPTAVLRVLSVPSATSASAVPRDEPCSSDAPAPMMIPPPNTKHAFVSIEPTSLCAALQPAAH